jgi:PIN domain nuclease of toxin-antitoxin system
MRLLLDTHVFLWFISGSDRIPARVRSILRDPQNEVFLSVASVWEAVIKYQLRKLELPESPATYLPAQRRRHNIVSLPIEEAALEKLASLPALHHDPFDRLIAAQAQQHGLLVVSVDDALIKYPIAMLAWA